MGRGAGGVGGGGGSGIVAKEDLRSVPPPQGATEVSKRTLE